MRWAVGLIKIEAQEGILGVQRAFDRRCNLQVQPKPKPSTYLANSAVERLKKLLRNNSDSSAG